MSRKRRVPLGPVLIVLPTRLVARNVGFGALLERQQLVQPHAACGSLCVRAHNRVDAGGDLLSKHRRLVARPQQG